MAKVDNSKIFLNGVYTDAIVKVPANTTYAAGTVLARNTDGDLTGYDSTVITAADTFYILAQSIVNDTDSDDTFELVRVLDGGAVDKSKLIFLHNADAEDETVLDKLRLNHFSLENVQELT